MIPKYLEFERFYTLRDLYNKLTSVVFLQNKIQLEDERIKITFHDHYMLTVKLNSYFNVYINDIFYYNIEEQDIWESICELTDDKSVIIECNSILKNRKVKVMQVDDFNKQKNKIMQKKNLKVFNTREIIFNS